jgi:large subunit ribosomal protein L13
MNKTYRPNTKDITPKWHLVDADGRVLGKLATEVSTLLLGKDKATYTPGVLSGNHVVVTNSSKISVTGNKMKKKVYYRHSNYPGGLKSETLGQLMKKDPTKAVERAVKGMLPTTKLRKRYMANLHVYAESEHPHSSQVGARK